MQQQLTKQQRDALVDIVRDAYYSEGWEDVKYALVALTKWIETNVPVQEGDGE